MADVTFNGFPKEGLEFLADLGKNNNRKWFEAHKKIYQEKVIEPAQAFVETLGAELEAVFPRINYDTRLDGSGSLMRIYRDTRFSKDKSPYRTYLGIFFWEGAGKKMENPGFFFSIEASGAHLGTGKYVFPKPVLESYRKAVADKKLGAELEDALDAAWKAGATNLGGEDLKRVPRGYDPEHERADLLRHKGLYMYRRDVGSSKVTSPKFIDMCLDWSEKTAALHKWLVKITKHASR
jgi:uncharacterized protein (TIGR02453 family)